jgi:hypothetical protein
MARALTLGPECQFEVFPLDGERPWRGPGGWFMH